MVYVRSTVALVRVRVNLGMLGSMVDFVATRATSRYTLVSVSLLAHVPVLDIIKRLCTTLLSVKFRFRMDVRCHASVKKPISVIGHVRQINALSSM